MKIVFLGFDGKWYMADDHTGPSALSIIQERLDRAMQKILDKEAKANGGQIQDGNNLPQRAGETLQDDDKP